MHWEVEELEKALYAGDVMLAKRYLAKIKAFLWCPKCKQPIQFGAQNAVPYFKGYAHPECMEAVAQARGVAQ